MMKKALVVLAVMAVASTAMAVPTLTAIPTLAGQTGGEALCITPDGMYVGGNASGTAIKGWVWSAANGTAQPVAGGYQERVEGIGYWTNGTTTALVIEGNNGGWQSTNSSTNGGVTWTKNRRTSTHAYFGAGGSNRMAGNSVVVGTDNVIYSTFQTNNTTEWVDGWAGVAGAWAPNTPASKSNTDESSINGVSNAGYAVGSRRLSGVVNNYFYQYDGDVGLANGYLAGMDGTNAGRLYDIADNGTVAGGYTPVTGKTGWYPYIRVMGTGALRELPGLGGGTVGATNGVLYGISPAGDYAVGMDYSYGSERAVLWNISDVNNITVIDLTALATSAGQLGTWGAVNGLRKAFAVGVDGAGNPVVAGRGLNSLNTGWTPFVMTVPEPTTVLFLALGGLAMLRRR